MRVNCYYYFNPLNLRKPIKVCVMPFRDSWPALINFIITASLTASYYVQNVPGRSSSKYDVIQNITDNVALQIVSRDNFWLQGRAPSDANLVSLDASRAQRELISQLEAKNKEIMREIARLRYTCVVYIPLYQA